MYKHRVLHALPRVCRTSCFIMVSRAPLQNNDKHLVFEWVRGNDFVSYVFCEGVRRNNYKQMVLRTLLAKGAQGSFESHGFCEIVGF